PFGLRSGGRPRCRGARPMDAASLFAPLLADRARQNATQAIGIRKGHALMAAGIQHTSSRGRGRMRRRAMAEINVTPFVDVMLVLLIVFMVTAPLLTVGVPVDLPRTQAKQLESEADPLTITIHADGVVYVQDTAVPLENLVGQIRAISREGYDRRVFIRADTNASYGLVADVMARLSSSGFRNLGLVTDTQHGPRVAPPAQPRPQRDRNG